ncbi:antichymotrypsin-2-like isoform X2 [Galleria mellonella]|uniref:Antichymotrypsin-2-like isoform X2 n=1 Tax=Galleria mellonella TaxID=7137 RepID=A0A6J1WJT1_GALME|nr:antichymotrypsin-2-like isoform X2 [Galleria mellonella]
MLKLILFVAFMANVIIVSTTGEIKCNKPNEVFEICPAKCPFRTCGIDDRVILCAAPPKVGDPDCPPSACRCKNGFFRDDKENCVKWEDCPPRCSDHEIYEKCPNPCIPQKCSQVGFPIFCPAQSTGNPPSCITKPACICESGYYRNCDGVCVPSQECPSCGGDPNARPGCGNCRKTCANYNSTDPIMCIQICYENACDCLPGYVVDGNTGKCVLPEDCTPICPKDEIYTSCVIGGCNKRNCSQLSQPKICINPINPCLGGCVCRDGYLRAQNGTCVPIDQCDSGELTATAAPSTSSCDNVNDQLNDFEDGNIRFTGKFFYEVVKSKPGVSVIMSAFSVLTPLAELALYSSGPSLEELLQVFDLQNKDEIRCVFTQIKNILEAEQNNTLDLGAKVFVNQDFLLTDEFKNDTRDVFDAEAENIDVGDPDKAAAIINDWAAEQTRNRITGVISPESITSYTRLILANAIYFKGTWKTKFDPKDTENKDFSVTKDDTIQVKTMKVKDKFKYAESTDLDAKIIELPYTGDAIRFIGILPNDIEGLTNLLEKLQDPDAFNKALNSLTLETVTVLLPTMDISTTIDLTDILPKTDVTKIFNADTSNLSGIIESNEPLYVSDGTQKANIIVNEEGSEASAVNVVGVSTTSVVLNPPVELFFNVDHPVAYYILYNNIPLFCGTFVKP